MGQLSVEGMKAVLASNVVEVRFRSRGGYGSRRMLCTNSRWLLNSAPGLIALKFLPPKGVGLPYVPEERGLVVAWDMFRQQYRQISIETAFIHSLVPLKTREDMDVFWDWFREYLAVMSPGDKVAFMRR